MDPISTLFSAYLEMITNITHKRLVDNMNTEITPVVIQYDGMDIPFQHQSWKVRDTSVCDSYRHQMLEYSNCTIKAKRLFGELCEGLSNKDEDNVKFVRAKNMYCKAAVSYQPRIANISSETEMTSLQSAQQKCNIATAAALGSSDEQLKAERNEACVAYRELKARQ